MKQLFKVSTITLLLMLFLYACGSYQRVINFHTYETTRPMEIIDSIAVANGIENYPLNEWQQSFMYTDGITPVFNYYLIQTVGDSIYTFDLLQIDSINAFLKYKSEKK